MSKKRIYYGLLLLIFIGCAASRYEKAEVFYETQDYEALIESGLDCSEFSTECFKLKYYRTEGFYERDDIDATLASAAEAIARVNDDIPLYQITRLYSLQTEMRLEKLSMMSNASDKAALLRDLESSLREVLAVLKSRQAGEQYLSDYRTFQLLLGKSLLKRMDLLTGKNREILYDRILRLLQDYDDVLVSQGYQQYYKFLADYYLVEPEISAWIYQGTLQREREALLNELKSLYKEALALRKLPLYEQDESDAIESYIRRIDDTMKQLIL